jgi:hypothetical protein
MSSGNQVGLKLNGAHHFLYDADDVIILRGCVHNIKKFVVRLVVSSEQTKEE